MPDVSRPGPVQLLELVLTDAEHLLDAPHRRRLLQHDRVVAQRGGVLDSAEITLDVAGDMPRSQEAGIEISHSRAERTRAIALEHSDEIGTELLDGAAHAGNAVVVGSDHEGVELPGANARFDRACGFPQHPSALLEIARRRAGRRLGVHALVERRAHLETERARGGRHDLPQPCGAGARVRIGVVGRLDKRQVDDIRRQPRVAQHLGNHVAVGARSPQRFLEAITIALLTANVARSRPYLGGGLARKQSQEMLIGGGPVAPALFELRRDGAQLGADKAAVPLDLPRRSAPTTAGTGVNDPVHPLGLLGVVKDHLPRRPAAKHHDPEIYAPLQLGRAGKVVAAAQLVSRHQMMRIGVRDKERG